MLGLLKFGYFCHSERSEESLFRFFLSLNRREILRFAQNDKSKRQFRVLNEESVRAWKNFEVWWRGLMAAGIAGGANGVITGFAAVGIDPQHFNLQAGLRSTLAIAAVSALMSSIIGVAAYLKQSPLPGQ